MLSQPLAITVALLALLATASAQLQPKDTGRNCGRYRDYDNGNFCIPCPPRHIASGTNVFQCTLCENKDEYPDFEGSYCNKCHPGNFLSKHQVCTPCPYNTYTDMFAAPKCIPCALGEHTDYEAASSKDRCESCGPGTYEEVFGSEVVCPCCHRGTVSTVNPTTKQRSCKPCPEGMTAGKCKDTCKKCPVGTSGILITSWTTQRFCFNCKGATYADEPGTKVCKPCPAGSVSSPDGGRCVAECVPGTPGCNACGPGMEPNGSGGCQKCPPGTANMFVSTTKCVPCPKPLIPSTARNMCVCRGKMVPYRDSNRCRKCPTFTTFKDDGVKKCVCPNGKVLENSRCICPIAQKPDGDGCTPCTAAERASKGNKCTLCKRDQRLDLKTQTCVSCPAGTVQDEASLKETCTKCLATHVLNGMLICGCAPGSRWVVNKCVKCPAGKALSGSRCESCGMEFYSDVAGLAKCKRCKLGQRYSIEKEQTSCPPKCPARQQDGVGACKCKPKFVNKGTATKPICEKCPPGTTPDGKSCKCEKCGEELKDGKCVPCPKGHSSDGSKCMKCGINRVPDRAGCHCDTCPTMYYSLIAGVSKCIKCNKGEYVTKANTCDKCKPGFRVRNGECVKCDPNNVNSGGDMAFCIPCGDKKASPDGSKCV